MYATIVTWDTRVGPPFHILTSHYPWRQFREVQAPNTLGIRIHTCLQHEHFLSSYTLLLLPSKPCQSSQIPRTSFPFLSLNALAHVF